MKFSSQEIKDLVLSWLIISLAFAFLFETPSSLWQTPLIFGLAFVVALFTAGIGFLLHELMHKYVAQSYGLEARYHAFYGMLMLALVFSLFGFILAAPGAVFISGLRITKEKNGKISLAGPMTNVLLGAGFLLVLIVFQLEGFWQMFFSYGLSINAFLALFNMIPVMPFDGGKIWSWSKTWHLITVGLALALFVASFLF